MREKSIVIVALALLTQTACATVTPGQWTGSRTFVGVVRVDMPATTGDLQAVRVRTLGAAVGSAGAVLGWEDGQWVIADPAACQLLVIVRNPVEAEHAALVLRQLRGQDICLVNETP